MFQGLVEFVESRDPALAARARQALADLLARPLQWEAEPQSALATLARTGSPEARPALQRWLTGSKNSTTRGLALAGLARTEGEGAVPFLLGHIEDPGLRAIVAGEVAARKQGSSALALARRLKGSLVAADSPATVTAVARALHDIAGPDAASLTADLLPRVPASVRMELTWAARGWTVDDAVARAQAIGLLDSADLDAARRQAREDADGEDPEPASVLFRVFDAAGIHLAFDVEADEVPVGYDRLLGEFAAQSRGRFRPEGVQEEWGGEGSDDGRGDYTVSFVHDGRLYRFAARDQGDWFDVEPVVVAIHRALQDAGRSERFHILDSDGQVARFLFGDPATIRRFATEIALPIGEDPDAARRLGQEFERQVLAEMGK